MRAFTMLDGLVVPLNRRNVDTDAILPKQFLKSIQRTGFGPYLFDEWRYLNHGEPGMDCQSRPLNLEFPLNQDRFRGAEILLCGENFGCGSSREHAVWALDGYGIRALVAPSFANIFQGNCVRNGILPVSLDPSIIDGLFTEVIVSPGFRLQIDLSSQTVTLPTGERYEFAIDNFRKQCLLHDLDDIELTLRHADEIREYEKRRLVSEPWIFN